MAFAALFTAIRIHREMEGSNRKQIRDRIRATRLRNDGKPKDMS